MADVASEVQDEIYSLFASSVSPASTSASVLVFEVITPLLTKSCHLSEAKAISFLSNGAEDTY